MKLIRFIFFPRRPSPSSGIPLLPPLILVIVLHRKWCEAEVLTPWCRRWCAHRPAKHVLLKHFHSFLQNHYIKSATSKLCFCSSFCSISSLIAFSFIFVEHTYYIQATKFHKLLLCFSLISSNTVFTRFFVGPRDKECKLIRLETSFSQ